MKEEAAPTMRLQRPANVMFAKVSVGILKEF